MAVKIQLRGDTAANWTAANPILADRELAIVTDTNAYKIGNGITAWNDLSYRELTPVVTALVMDAVADPSPPAPGFLDFYAKPVCGRMMPKWRGPSGLHNPVQPALFQNSVFLVSPGASTALSTVGGNVTSVGTLSHPAVANGTFGHCANYASTAVANATAGTGHISGVYCGASGTAANGGYFMVQRLWWPDADYGVGATGSRHFVGLSDQTMAFVVGNDNPAGSRIAFMNSTVLGETNWMLSTRNGTTETRVSTGIPFATNHLFDFFLFMAPGDSEVHWRIDDLSAGTTAEGVTSSTLPGSSVYMRAGFQIATLTTVARNVRMKKIYVETDG